MVICLKQQVWPIEITTRSGSDPVHRFLDFRKTCENDVKHIIKQVSHRLKFTGFFTGIAWVLTLWKVPSSLDFFYFWPCEKPVKKTCEKAASKFRFHSFFSQVVIHRFFHRFHHSFWPCEKCPVHRFSKFHTLWKKLWILEVHPIVLCTCTIPTLFSLGQVARVSLAFVVNSNLDGSFPAIAQQSLLFCYFEETLLWLETISTEHALALLSNQTTFAQGITLIQGTNFHTNFR